MSDTLNCFSSLQENLPKWLEDLSSLSKKMEDRPKESAPPAKQKSGSVESLRPVDNAEPGTGAGLSTDPLPPSNAHPQPSNLAKRKRKPGSLISMSGPSRYRTKPTAIVYYDSEIQQAFEDLVRGIGAARNQLRKGKMAARMESLANLTADLDGDENDDNTPALSPKIGYRPRIGVGGFRSTRALGASKGLGEAGNESFDAVDKALEKAQALCERAAHQALRDGNPQLEIEHTRSKFEEALKFCSAELDRRKTEATKRQSKEVTETTSEDTPQQPPKSLSPSLGLEVDDDETEQPIALPPIRLMSRV